MLAMHVDQGSFTTMSVIVVTQSLDANGRWQKEANSRVIIDP
jgi:hypothetical protein